MKSIFRSYKYSVLEKILLIGSFLLLGWAIISQIKGTGWSLWFETNGLDHIGSFMGGLFALISIFYLIKNLAEQRRITTLQSFETNYLEIVKFCREQVAQASIPDPDSTNMNEHQINGREIFSLFFVQIENAIKVVGDFVQTKGLRNMFESSQNFDRDQNIWGDKLQDRTVASIAYLITYIGVKNRNINLLKSKYLSTYNQVYIGELLNAFRIKLARYAPEDLRSSGGNRLQLTEKLTCDDKEYYGFQDQIGNYFRLLYHAVTFVNNQLDLSYEEKYKYIKLLRGQMSNTEEAILFYNSLCDLGLAWEYDTTGDTPDLITKYNLIKNIPQHITKVSFEQFYPNVYYEFLTEEPHNRKKYTS